MVRKLHQLLKPKHPSASDAKSSYMCKEHPMCHKDGISGSVQCHGHIDESSVRTGEDATQS